MAEPSEVEKLRRLLLEEQQARQQAEQEKQQAEQEIRRTTLKEFFQGCHEHLHMALSVETNRGWTTGGTPVAKDKYYPKTLKPWTSFSDLQAATVKALNPMLLEWSAERCFSSLSFLKGIGEELDKKIRSEKDLEKYEGMAVENRVTAIIKYICENAQCVEGDYNLGEEVTFENHANTLNDSAVEVQDGLRIQERLQIQTPQTSPQHSRTPSPTDADSNAGSKPTRTYPDQFCVFKTENGKRKLLFIVEYKAPHKVSVGSLREGFQKMDVEEQLHQVTIPTEEVANAKHHAKDLAAAVATQTFHYMIENGLEYSYITTGEAFVFLRIDWDDPTTLLYHVAVPSDEVAADNAGGDAFAFHRTAVSQVLGLCLLASRSEQVCQGQRKCAMLRLQTWNEDENSEPCQSGAELDDPSLYTSVPLSPYPPSVQQRVPRSTSTSTQHGKPNIYTSFPSPSSR